MRCLIYQLASDRLHNLQMGIDAFLWRLPETESSLARGPGAMFRAYVDGPDGRQRLALRWGFEPAWVGHDGLRLLGKGPWPWVAAERAPASRVFAHPLRYQRCLIPADSLYVGRDGGIWFTGPGQTPMFLAGVWDQGTFALLTADTPPKWHDTVGARMPVALPADQFDRWLAPAVTCLQFVQEMIGSRRQDWALAEARPATAPGWSPDTPH